MYKRQHIYNEENICGTNNFMWDGFAVHFYFLYRIWMQKNMKLLADCFAENQDSGYFNAADVYKRQHLPLPWQDMVQ